MKYILKLRGRRSFHVILFILFSLFFTVIFSALSVESPKTSQNILSSSANLIKDSTFIFNDNIETTEYYIPEEL